MRLRPDLAASPRLIESRPDFAAALAAIAGDLSVTRLEAAAEHRFGPRALPATTVRGWLRGTSFPADSRQFLKFLSCCGVNREQAAALNAARLRVQRLGKLELVIDYDPIDLGVHRSVTVNGQKSRLPFYVIRHHDSAIRGLLEDIADARLIILVGGSATGKTRACYEAVLSRLANWRLVHPRTQEGLLELIAEGLSPRTVLWLNETQNFLSGPFHGQVAQALASVLRNARQVVVIGSMWQSYYSYFLRAADAKKDGTALKPEFDSDTTVRDLLEMSNAHILNIPADFSEPEDLTTLRSASTENAELAQALRAAGPEMRVTQTLAGGPFLVGKYERWQHSDDATERSAWAILTAAIDLRRLGHEGELTPRLLAAASPGYLPPRFLAQPESWFDSAISLAVASDRGVQPLESVRRSPGIGLPDGYLVHDYLLEYGERHRRRLPTPEGMWASLLDPLPNRLDAGRLAHQAMVRGLFRYAESLFIYAAVEAEVGESLDGLTSFVNYLQYRRDEKTLQKLADAGWEYALERLAFLWFTRGNLAGLRGLAEDRYYKAEHWLARSLQAVNDVEALRALAATGNGEAGHSLVELLRDRGDIAGLRQMGDLDVWEERHQAIRDVLMRRGDEDSLAELGQDPEYGLYHKIERARERGDEAVLRQYAETDYLAKEKLVEILRSRGDDEAFDELKGLQAYGALVEILLRRGDEVSIRKLSDSGVQAATMALAKILDDQGDEHTLRQLAVAGSWEASERLAQRLYERRDEAELQALADQDLFPAERLLVQLAVDFGNLERLVQLAGTSDLAFEALVDAHVRRGDLADLERLADSSDHARRRLIETTRDTEKLDSMARTGDWDAFTRLIALCEEQRDGDKLFQIWVDSDAYGGSPSDPNDARRWNTERALRSILINQENIARLRVMTDMGDVHAANDLVQILNSRHDLVRLREERNAGNPSATSALIRVLSGMDEPRGRFGLSATGTEIEYLASE